jgi:hypothetical protein
MPTEEEIVSQAERAAEKRDCIERDRQVDEKGIVNIVWESTDVVGDKQDIVYRRTGNGGEMLIVNYLGTDTFPYTFAVFKGGVWRNI